MIRGYGRERAEDGLHEHQPTPLTVGLVRQLVEGLSHDLAGLRDRALILLGFALGARRSELVALNLDDVRDVPEGLLVRIRAVFSAPTAFEEDRSWGYRQLVARGEVTKASLAVRAPSGKMFAFASLSASGGVSLFVARGCVDDS